MTKKVLFKLSGSIAAYKACYLISRLVQNNYEVQVVTTPSALEFVGRASLEGLTGKPVLTSTFEPGHYMHHIHLDKWADLVVLCPASANTINKLASGIGDDLLTTLFLAHDFNKPYLIAPAMNVRMYQHPTTQQALKTLAKNGCEVLSTVSGMLACGDEGLGKLMDPDQIFLRIEQLTSNLQTASRESTSAIGSDKIPRPLRVLVTTGGTTEPIDGVRSIVNFSSGLTGWTIANYFSQLGHDVTCLFAKRSRPAFAEADLIAKEFSTFDDLKILLKHELQTEKYDLVIHAAAVSDYRVYKINGKLAKSTSKSNLGKIDSGKKVHIELIANEKLINQIHRWSKNKTVRLVGFKLTNGAGSKLVSAKVDKLQQDAKCDLIVHNDIQQISDRQHPCQFYEKNVLAGQAANKFEMADYIHSWSMRSLATSGGKI